ncbi:hypothetical protein BDF21DRAFT_434120 [Thamnidium elegans]|nr:hypothetical protein BDF21DRAFT_434120 [Thamnidium elegans]
MDLLTISEVESALVNFLTRAFSYFISSRTLLYLFLIVVISEEFFFYRKKFFLHSYKFSFIRI